MKILCIGEALIDMICTDVSQPLREAQHFLKKAGGAPANVAAAIAALGGEVDLVAKVGSDPFGEHLVNVLASFGVGTSLIIKDEKKFTTLAFVSLMENGERDFYFSRGADGELSLVDLDNITLSSFSIVHFGSATAFLPGPLQAAYRGLLEKCLQEEVIISFDPNYRNLLFQHNKQSFIDQSWNYLQNCHFFKVSDEEAMMLTNQGTVEGAAQTFLQKTKAVFAITLGRDGTMLGLDNRTETIESIIVKPVDTTGAGDAFVGAVLHQLGNKKPGDIKEMSGENWKQIIYNANKAGARTCEYMGAMEAFKHLSSDIFA